MAKPIVAIVGRPNVGKSTLFNKLIGKRVSIVDDKPGVTRDRIYGSCQWNGKEITVIDTGGIEPRANDSLLSQMRHQAQVAIDAADAIIFVVDLQSGVTANDIEVGSMLQKSGKPIVLCVNKSDNIGALKPEFYEFYNLGLGEPMPVSSIHGHGSGDLLDAVYKHLDFSQRIKVDGEMIQVAVVGKPNVGKSSLVNHLAGDDRMIVENTPGTTRDAVDIVITYGDESYTFIDTAGIRRRAKVDESVERYSVMRAFTAVDRADVCVMMIDATEGFSEQDSKIAGYVHEEGKACIVAVNKWDLIEKDSDTMRDYKKQLEGDFAFMKYVPFIFISAKTGERIDKLFELIHYVYKQNNTHISTGKLNDMLAVSTARVSPPTDKGRPLKIYYITQSSVAPPSFVCFVNDHKLFHFSYRRYIENQIRETFELDATPIRIIVRERG